MKSRPSRLRVALTAGRLAGRRLMGRAVGQTDLLLGDRLTSQLDEMKGLAMKLGQIVSYMDVPLPEAVQSKLAALQTGQHGMEEAQTRAVIEAELGPVDSLFDDFDFVPVAAASIGQVHRASVDGRPVAVKVQYPDVARSFENDLGAMDRLASLASLASAVDGRAIVRELALRLTEECDYEREAVMQAAFAAAFADDPQVRIPQVMGARSGSTVLTSEWIEADTFDAVCRRADPARHARIAATLTRFTYRSLLELAAIQADPHPGNFLFDPDGRVVFLDFGCVRQFEPAFIAGLRQQIEAVRDNDRPSFREASLKLGMVGRPAKFDYDHFFNTMEHLYRPLLQPEFTFEREYVRKAMAYNGPSSPNARTQAFPPAFVWVSRLQWGLWSVLAKLGVRVSFEGLLDDLLSRPIYPMRGDPQSTTADRPGQGLG